jgi:hypothetical protein
LVVLAAAKLGKTRLIDNLEIWSRCAQKAFQSHWSPHKCCLDYQ